MQPLTPQEILQLWEQGQGHVPADAGSPATQLLALLECAYPEAEPPALAALTAGQAQLALLELRVRTFGRALELVDDCPACGAAVEITLDAAELRALAAGPAQSSGRLGADGLEVHFRVPTVGDLVAVAAAGARDPGEARRVLLARCVREVRAADGTAAAGTELAPATQEQLAIAMGEHDPAAELTAQLACPDCGHGWSATLDVATLLWREVTASARRLLGEVHELASRYGWSEADILGLSERRRQAYLQGAWV